MAQPNNGLITETNSQYYSGVQMFQADGTQYTYPTTFDTDLVFYNYSPTDDTYGKNNFKLIIIVLIYPWDDKILSSVLQSK